MKELNSPMIKEQKFLASIETPLPLRVRPKLEMFSDGNALRERHDIFVNSVVGLIKSMAHLRVDINVIDYRNPSHAYFEDNYNQCLTSRLVISNHMTDKSSLRSELRIISSVQQGLFSVCFDNTQSGTGECENFMYLFKQTKENTLTSLRYEQDYVTVTARMTEFCKVVSLLVSKTVFGICTKDPVMYGMDLTRENFILVPNIKSFKAYLKGENVASVFIPIYPRPDKDEHNKDEIPTFLNVENQYTYSIDDLNPFYGVLFTDPIKPIEVTKEEE